MPGAASESFHTGVEGKWLFVGAEPPSVRVYDGIPDLSVQHPKPHPFRIALIYLRHTQAFRLLPCRVGHVRQPNRSHVSRAFIAKSWAEGTSSPQRSQKAGSKNAVTAKRGVSLVLLVCPFFATPNTPLQGCTLKKHMHQIHGPACDRRKQERNQRPPFFYLDVPHHTEAHVPANNTPIRRMHQMVPTMRRITHLSYTP